MLPTIRLFPNEWITLSLRWLTLGIAMIIGVTPLLSVAQEKPSAQESDWLNAFGIVGDGIADDTVAIQRAIDSASGALRFPKGVYRITHPLVVELDRKGFTSFLGDGVATIQMDGSGPAIRFIGTHFKSADPTGFQDGVWQRQRMPLVDGLGITATHDEADGIEAVGTMQLTITRTHIRGCRHGVRLVKNNRNVLVSDCHIYENSGIGIFYDDVNLHQSNITGSHISYNGGGGIVSRGGNVRNLHITGCDIESNMSPDHPPTANILIDCRGGTHGTAEVAITGCTIQHNHKAPESANIRILGRSNDETNEEVVREGNVTITGNVLSDVDTNIHLQDCRGVTLTGNTFWMGFRHNLLIENSASIVMAANNMDRNPRYAYGTAKEAKNTVVFRNCQDCTITGLHITNIPDDEIAVSIERSSRMNINGCTILDYGKIGLLLEELVDSRLSGCLIHHAQPSRDSTPVQVVGGRGNRFELE